MRHLLRLLAAAALVLSTAVARADLGDQLFELLHGDGAPGDRFGNSVAISGTTAIVGAHIHEENGIRSGSAYLFDATTGQQIAELLPDDGAISDLFGCSVAISGTTAIVGARQTSDNGINSGSAYLFDTTTGAQLAKLLPDDGEEWDFFGAAVAISGTTAIIGVLEDDDNGSNAGAAYLFDTTTGGQLAKLYPDDTAPHDYFGRAVAISGTTAIIGAPMDDDACPGDQFCESGSAYLFDTTTGQQIAKLLPSDGAELDFFGYSVAISGATAIVGAWGDDDNGTDSGSAYTFDITTGQQLAKLLPDDGAARDGFGYSIAISGATAVVGAVYNRHGNDFGLAYLFDTATGQQLARLLANDSSEDDRFGISVAISGTTALVGDDRHDDNGSSSGAAFLFDAAYGSACPWDLDGNDNVGPYDLAYVLGFWGPNPGHPADLDGDGEVGPLDLALVLGNWGPCP